MTDTPRSLSDLLVVFADNTTKLIKAQGLRDLAVSVLGGHGGLYLSAAAAPQTLNIAAAKIVAWDGAFVASGTTPSASSDDVTIAVAARYSVRLHLSFLGAAGRAFTFQVRQNGVAVPGAYDVRTLASGTDVVGIVVDAIVDCAANDVLSAYGLCDVDVQSVTIKAGQLTVKRLS